MCNRLYKFQKITLGRKEITLRNPRISDVKTLLDFINSLVKEDSPILVNKKATLKEEKEWLKDRIKLVKKNRSKKGIKLARHRVVILAQKEK